MFAPIQEHKQTKADKTKSDANKQPTITDVTSSNLTGIPNEMKTQVERLSGYSFNDIRVHYNSDKPAKLQAFAYTQGNQVYISSGQEQQLGHELGHVVQQKQGRVHSIMQLQGVNINDDAGLEREANTFGDRIIQNEYKTSAEQTQPTSHVVQSETKAANQTDMPNVLQRHTTIQRVEWSNENKHWKDKFSDKGHLEEVQSIASKNNDSNQYSLSCSLKKPFKTDSDVLFNNEPIHHYSTNEPNIFKHVTPTQTVIQRAAWVCTRPLLPDDGITPTIVGFDKLDDNSKKPIKNNLTPNEHRQIMFDKKYILPEVGYQDNIGYFLASGTIRGPGILKNDAGIYSTYEKREKITETNEEDRILIRAIKDIGTKGRFKTYNVVLSNCQDWVSSVINKYHELKAKKSDTEELLNNNSQILV